MSTIRIEKNKNYTTMSNYHLRDMELSLKAKGLLSFMLSLPEDWDYSVRGLAKILLESEGTIKTILKELEARGYLVRDQKVDPCSGKFGKAEYTVFEKSQINQEVEPWVKNPTAVKPTAESYPTNIYTNKQITKEKKKEKDLNVLNGFSKEKLSPSETKKLDFSIVKRQIVKGCNDLGESEKITLCTDIFSYYYMRYEEMLGKGHMVLSSKAITDVIKKIVAGTEVLEDNSISYDLDVYKAIIDQHFKVAYEKKIDYNICHFMSDDIRNNRYYETC